MTQPRISRKQRGDLEGLIERIARHHDATPSSYQTFTGLGGWMVTSSRYTGQPVSRPGSVSHAVEQAVGDLINHGTTVLTILLTQQTRHFVELTLNRWPD